MFYRPCHKCKADIDDCKEGCPTDREFYRRELSIEELQNLCPYDSAKLNRCEYDDKDSLNHFMGLFTFNPFED